jgi:hypothetical protein
MASAPLIDPAVRRSTYTTSIKITPSYLGALVSVAEVTFVPVGFEMVMPAINSTGNNRQRQRLLYAKPHSC